MQRFDCLDKNLSLKGNYFLEASAGTGKTFAIEHTVCRLIINGVPPDQILITTFTKASTRDLRCRIYETLKEAHTALITASDAVFPYLQEIENTDQVMLFLQNALSLIDEMQIFTICSFCYRMLSEYAFEAKIDFQLDDPEQSQKKGQIALAVLDVLRTTVDENIFSVAQLHKLMQTCNKDIKRFVRKMVSLLEQDPTLPDDFIAYEKLHALFLSKLDSIDIENLISDLYEMAPSYKKVCNKEGSIHDFVKEQIDALSKKDFESLIRAPLSMFELFTDENLKQKKERHPTRYIIDQIGEIVTHASNPNFIFLEMAKIAKMRVREREITNPNFFLETMLNALEIESFQNHIRNRYSALIIDEFQDTDPLSWKIFYTLFFNYVDLFLVVGDPKQSIYAFRGADLATFLKAKKSFSTTYALATNYRSTKEMIHILNTLFNEEKLKGLFSFSEDDRSLHYYEIEAGKKEEAKSPLSVHFPIFSGPSKPKGPFPTNDMEENLIFPYIAAEIQKLEKDGFDLNGIAVLVKDRFVAAKLLDYLQRANISVLSGATSSIIESSVFDLFFTLFQLNEAPRSLNLIKQALMHPLINWPIDALKCGIEDELMQQLIVSFTDLKKLFDENGVAPYLAALLDLPFPKIPLAEIIAKNRDAYSDLLQIVSLIIESHKPDPFLALEEMANKDVDENPELKRKPLIEDSAISILTSHMSKGLEYEVVFALGVGSRTTTKQDLIKDTTGKMRVFKEDDPNCFDALIANDKEKMRLFYVALTRARERLYIITPLDANQKIPTYGSASPIELYFARLLSDTFLPYHELYTAIGGLTPKNISLKLLEMDISHEVIEEVSLEKIEPKNASITINEPITLDLAVKPKQFLSFSSMPNPLEKSLHEKIEPQENELPFGSAIGSLFHLLFEKIIEEGLYYLGDEADLQSFVEKELVATPLFDWREEVFSLVQTAFTTPIQIPNEEPFSLNEIPPNQMIQEMQFSYLIDEQTTMKGFIDLFFYHKGKYYLLDWKLNRLSSYTKESIELAMQEHNYYLQAEIYTKALALHLQSKNLEGPLEDHFGGFIYFFLRGQENGLYFIGQGQGRENPLAK